MPPEVDWPRAWLRYAEAGLAYAEAPVPPSGLYEVSCFHAQQAAEKAVKAVLVRENGDFPPTHSLEVLVSLLPQTVPHTAALSEVGRLTAYAVLARYPGQAAPVSEADRQQALAIAKQVVA